MRYANRAHFWLHNIKTKIEIVLINFTNFYFFYCFLCSKFFLYDLLFRVLINDRYTNLLIWLHCGFLVYFLQIQLFFYNYYYIFEINFIIHSKLLFFWKYYQCITYFVKYVPTSFNHFVDFEIMKLVVNLDMLLFNQDPLNWLLF